MRIERKSERGEEGGSESFSSRRFSRFFEDSSRTEKVASFHRSLLEVDVLLSLATYLTLMRTRTTFHRCLDLDFAFRIEICQLEKVKVSYFLGSASFERARGVLVEVSLCKKRGREEKSGAVGSPSFCRNKGNERKVAIFRISPLRVCASCLQQQKGASREDRTLDLGIADIQRHPHNFYETHVITNYTIEASTKGYDC